MVEPSSGRFVVVGQVARDLVLQLDALPGPGQSTTVDGRSELLGGKGANIAVGLAQLGAPVDLVGVVGEDTVGRWLVEQVRRDGIGAAAFTTRAGTASALMVDAVTGDAQRHQLESVPDEVLLDVADVVAARPVLAEATTLVLQQQQPAQALLAAAAAVDRGRCRVVLDGVAEDERLREELLGRAHVVRMDATETAILAGHPVEDPGTALDVARRLQRRGPRVVAVALDGVGDLVVADDRAHLVPYGDATVVDTTGAGDAFVAALAWALADDLPAELAARTAAAAAGLTVGHAGGRPRLSAERVRQQADRLTARQLR
ncbi:ribokinase [Auraticoccus sp. F435]|uniref:Ribokinase n=1 Tax=Auraticoccus cholistanensis TaxID=2656650 RepID=A0A6A9URU1_9ACTN|nr:ribokinase [Auraticoccus cholistanensis]